MRSVFIFFPASQQSAVAGVLTKLLGESIELRWTDQRSVWATFIDPKNDFDADEIEGIASALGTTDFLCVMADISGRIPGVKEATDLCMWILECVPGVAMDDYSARLWTLDQMRTGAKFTGKSFFDTDGWYAERKTAQPGATDNPGDAQ